METATGTQGSEAGGTVNGAQMSAQTVESQAGAAQQAAQAVATPAFQQAPPVQAPAPLYPQYLAQPQPASPASNALAAGVMGMIIVGTGAMGANLHRVNDGKMNMTGAVTDSVAKGAAGAAAAAGATYASSSLTSGGFLGLAVTLAAGTGISYLLTK